MNRLVLVLLLVLCSAEGAAAQESFAGLIIRPSIGFVMGRERTGSAILYADDSERAVRVELGNGRVAFGAQAEYNIDAHLFFALGGQSSLHTATARTIGSSIDEDRQFLHFWAGPGLRSRFITVMAGPLLLREMLPDVEFEPPYGPPVTQTCAGGGEDVNHWGWTGVAMFEFPISAKASFSFALQRHAVRWNANTIGRDASRGAVAPFCPSPDFRLPEWRSATTSNPAIYTFQAGVAVPVF